MKQHPRSARSSVTTLRSSLTRLLGDVFKGRDPSEGAAVAARKPGRAERHGFGIEAIEPRVLLSADIDYPSLSNAGDVGVTELTLKVENSGGLFLKLYETANLANEVASVEFDGAGDEEVNIGRALDVGAAFGDTIRLDLST
ncbi:MAG TPA: LEPR-XLL domain-containing protein, partial [Aquabacterium sp.]|nr:LEPR-XLL domain-containing protein [Aquabacterium sp.]